MIRNRFGKLFTAVALGAALCTNAFPQRPASVIQRHLDSVGNAETRAALKDMTAAGSVRFTVLRTGGVGADGKIVLASAAEKTLLGMTFPLPSYPSETITFDGKKLKVAFTINNTRSPLGDFLYRYPEIIKQGLFGGTLTSSWTLYDESRRKPRLEYDGRKWVDGNELLAISYLARGGSDVEVRIFLEVDTYRHVRTEYRRVISASQGGSVDSSSQRRGQRQVMIEEFSDFRNESGLTLPHSHRIYLLLDGETDTREFEWNAVYNQFFFNQQLDASVFNTDGR